jgi:two-component system sensor histidine kinase YesM
MNTNTSNKKTISLSLKLQRLILAIVFVVIVAFLISVYMITSKERREYERSESESVLKNLSSNIATDIDSYRELSRLIMTEDRLVSFLRADVDSVDISMINDARYGIIDILNVTEGVDTVFVIREDMIMLSTNRFTYQYDYDMMRQEEWRKEIYDAKGAIVVSLNSNGVAAKSGDKPMVTLGRAIYDIDSQERTGIMLMNISAVIFDRMLRNLRYNNICIMGDDGTFLAGNRDMAEYFDSSFVSKKIMHKDIMIEKEQVLLSGCKVDKLPIVILRTSSYDNEGIPFTAINVLIFMLAIFIILAAFTATFISRNITDPVFKLSAAMEENRTSGELKKIDVKMPGSELEMLEGDYNNMIDHVNELIDRLMEKEKTLQRAEMRVLQEQIKPHFLYNSIETIGFMALDAGADKVHDALETMGSFYRNFLSKGDREIPLSREISIVKDYLSLQKLRYGDIIEDEYEISSEAESFIVPKLILQPLAENSIYHGIRMKGEKGLISFKAEVVKSDDESSFARELHIYVTDTGVGMDREKIKKILSVEKKDRPKEADESFGLWGTVERIRMYTGMDDCVKIESEPGEYTKIEITIPDMSVRMQEAMSR